MSLPDSRSQLLVYKDDGRAVVPRGGDAQREVRTEAVGIDICIAVFTCGLDVGPGEVIPRESLLLNPLAELAEQDVARAEGGYARPGGGCLGGEGEALEEEALRGVEPDVVGRVGCLREQLGGPGGAVVALGVAEAAE